MSKRQGIVAYIVMAVFLVAFVACGSEVATTPAQNTATPESPTTQPAEPTATPIDPTAEPAAEQTPTPQPTQIVIEPIATPNPW